MYEGLLPLPETEELMQWYEYDEESLFSIPITMSPLAETGFCSQYGWQSDMDNTPTTFVDMHCLRLCVKGGNLDQEKCSALLRTVLDMTSIQYYCNNDVFPLSLSVAFQSYVLHVRPFDPRSTPPPSAACFQRRIERLYPETGGAAVPETTFPGDVTGPHDFDDFMIDVPLLSNYLSLDRPLKLLETSMTIGFPNSVQFPEDVSFASGCHYMWDASQQTSPEPQVRSPNRVLAIYNDIYELSELDDDWTCVVKYFYTHIYEVYSTYDAYLFIQVVGTNARFADMSVPTPPLIEAWFVREMGPEGEERNVLDVTRCDRQNFIILLPEIVEATRYHCSILLVFDKHDLEHKEFELRRLVYVAPRNEDA